jgi:V-type H+-transporting ATPase subunit A
MRRLTRNNRLSDSEDLDQVVQLVGKSSLSDPDKIILDVAAIVKEDFLQQNGYSEWDYRCPLYKTDLMMKCLMVYYDEAQKAIQQGAQWNRVREHTREIENELRSMKFRVSPPTHRHLWQCD